MLKTIFKLFFVSWFRVSITSCVNYIQSCLLNAWCDLKGMHGDGCDFACVVCRTNGEGSNARNMTDASISELWRSSVCEKPSSEWHNLL